MAHGGHEVCEWVLVVEAIDKPIAELQVAVLSLHEVGFVHGDLRSNNILVLCALSILSGLVSQAKLCTHSLWITKM